MDVVFDTNSFAMFLGNGVHDLSVALTGVFANGSAKDGTVSPFFTDAV